MKRTMGSKHLDLYLVSSGTRIHQSNPSYLAFGYTFAPKQYGEIALGVNPTGEEKKGPYIHVICIRDTRLREK